MIQHVTLILQQQIVMVCFVDVIMVVMAVLILKLAILMNLHMHMKMLQLTMVLVFSHLIYLEKGILIVKEIVYMISMVMEYVMRMK